MTRVAGLSRFVRPLAPPVASLTANPVGESTVTTDPTATSERCELCAQQLTAGHTHLVDVRRRALVCSCRACYFLFTPEGAGGGRYRPVPDRYLYDPAFTLTPRQWDELSIPVGVLFVFQHSDADLPVAFYPGAAGATESLLPLDTWGRVMAANPAMADLLPDTEAVLLRRVGERFDGYLVPIDACYDLVGRVRLHWRGFSGGDEAWSQIDAFFDQLARRAQRVPSGGS